MSIYQGNKKVLGGITNIDSDKVKEIIDSERPIKTFTNITQLGLSAGCSVEDIFLALPNNSYFECGTASGVDGYSTITNLPTTSTSTLLTIRKYTQARFNIEVKISSSGDVEPNEMYIGQLKGSDGTGLTWSRVVSTRVADVPITSITPENSDVTVNGMLQYSVKNGICTVTAWGITSSSISAGMILNSNMPISKAYCLTTITDSTGASVGWLFIDATTRDLKLSSFKTGASGFGSFSYPVAE